MNIHNTHKITHQQYNGLLDPWHVCTVCGKSDKDLVAPCSVIENKNESEQKDHVNLINLTSK